MPLNYIEPLFRPPSEAASLILQVTNGCSYNRCTFCDMYTQPQKRFRPRAEADLLAEIAAVARRGYGVRRVFLADGDAMALSTRRLLAILNAIRAQLPTVQRVSAYCLPRNLLHKSDADLRQLYAAGLQLVYVGAESGDDRVLERVHKGESWDSTLTALNRLADAGIRRSVMILNGLGGKRYSTQHAIHSATLVNATQPEYLATLVVSFPQGMARFQAGYQGEFEPLSQEELFVEMRLLLQHLELAKTIFRSDHASNYLVLKGVLGRDKAHLLQQLQGAIDTPAQAHLRPEWARGL